MLSVVSVYLYLFTLANTHTQTHTETRIHARKVWYSFYFRFFICFFCCGLHCLHGNGVENDVERPLMIAAEEQKETWSVPCRCWLSFVNALFLCTALLCTQLTTVGFKLFLCAHTHAGTHTLAHNKATHSHNHMNETKANTKYSLSTAWACVCEWGCCCWSFSYQISIFFSLPFLALFSSSSLVFLLLYNLIFIVFFFACLLALCMKYFYKYCIFNFYFCAKFIYSLALQLSTKKEN